LNLYGHPEMPEVQEGISLLIHCGHEGKLHTHLEPALHDVPEVQALVAV